MAFATAGMLAAYHFHVHYSRLGSVQITDPFFMVLAFAFIYRGMKTGANRDWAFAGISCGASMYFYAGGRLTPILMLATVLYLFIFSTPEERTNLIRGTIVAAGAFLITAGPMLHYAMRFSEEFNARVNQVGIFQSGWLEKEIVILGQSRTRILWEQFKRSVLAFNFYQDRTVWFGLREPFMDAIFGGFFMVGMIYATIRAAIPPGDKKNVAMVGWWWSGVILGGMMTVNPPSSMRLVTLTVPTIYFVAVGVGLVLAQLKKAIPRINVNLLLAAVVITFCAVHINLYFIEFSPQRLYGSKRAEAATELAGYLNQFDEKPDVYFVGAPWMYWHFATLPFLVEDITAEDIIDPLSDSIGVLQIDPSDDSLFVFLPEREDELPLAQEKYPGGVLDQIVSPVDDQVLFTLYTVRGGDE